MISHFSGRIESTYEGFEKLIGLYRSIRDCPDDQLFIDMNQVTWLDANISAPLGALLVLPRVANPVLNIQFINVRPSLKKIWQKNGFLREKLDDTYNTTIQYQRFERTDMEAFKDYVTRHFKGKGIPTMTPALQKKFRESIAEIFENSKEHSRTKHGIFACGQFFPKKNRLDFSIVDLGLGIKRNIREKLQLDLPAEKAIEWALEADNTTRSRQEGKPGGFGLKLIKEFVRLNHGKIQIISDAGYWCFQSGKDDFRQFLYPFPGTVVNIEINTADSSSYRLASEVDPGEIW